MGLEKVSAPFRNSDRSIKTEEENNEDLMKRVERQNDAASIFLLANDYQHGLNGFRQDNV